MDKENEQSTTKRLICGIKEDELSARVFLYQYNGEEKEGYIWCHVIYFKFASNNEKELLNHINGISIPENSPAYGELKNLAANLNDLGYNPLTPFAPKEIIDGNIRIFEILRDFKK